MTHSDLSILFSSGRYTPVPFDKISVVLVEGEGSLTSAALPVEKPCWIEATDLPAETARYWGVFREQVPRIDAAHETTDVRIDVTCTTRGTEEARAYLLEVKTFAIEQIWCGRKLGGEKMIPISIGVPSYQEKVVAFLQARLYAFSWVDALRIHLQHLFQMSTQEEVFMYRSLLHLEQTEELPPTHPPLTTEEYALRCRWVEPHLDAGGQLIPLTHIAAQTLTLLQGKGLVEPFAGEYHTVEYTQGRVQPKKAGKAHLLLPEEMQPSTKKMQGANAREAEG